MKGSIRMLVGMLVTLGAIGTLDYNPQANLAVQTGLALLGLLIANSGVNAMNKEQL